MAQARGGGGAGTAGKAARGGKGKGKGKASPAGVKGAKTGGGAVSRAKKAAKQQVRVVPTSVNRRAALYLKPPLEHPLAPRRAFKRVKRV